MDTPGFCGCILMLTESKELAAVTCCGHEICMVCLCQLTRGWQLFLFCKCLLLIFLMPANKLQIPWWSRIVGCRCFVLQCSKQAAFWCDVSDRSTAKCCTACFCLPLWSYFWNTQEYKNLSITTHSLAVGFQFLSSFFFFLLSSLFGKSFLKSATLHFLYFLPPTCILSSLSILPIPHNMPLSSCLLLK